jgi:hypothetical protein
VLTFAGNGSNAGEQIVCLEARPFATGADDEFTSGILDWEDIAPVPVRTSTWGRIKRLYR